MNELIEKLKQIDELCLPNATGGVWLDDVIDVIEQHCGINYSEETELLTMGDVMVHLFDDLAIKYNKKSDEILITLQDNEIVVMEQDYEDMIVLERIALKTKHLNYNKIFLNENIDEL